MGINWDRNNITRVESVTPGGQAHQLGISAGDVLDSVNGSSLSPRIAPKEFIGLLTAVTSRACALSFFTSSTNDRDLLSVPLAAPSVAQRPLWTWLGSDGNNNGGQIVRYGHDTTSVGCIRHDLVSVASGMDMIAAICLGAIYRQKRADGQEEFFRNLNHRA